MSVINVRSLVSLQVQYYPECLEELRPRYKKAAAERRKRSHQWELFRCSIVYTGYYALAPNKRGIKRCLSDVCLTFVCLSRTSGLSREQRGIYI